MCLADVILLSCL